MKSEIFIVKPREHHFKAETVYSKLKGEREMIIGFNVNGVYMHRDAFCRLFDYECDQVFFGEDKTDIRHLIKH